MNTAKIESAIAEKKQQVTVLNAEIARLHDDLLVEQDLEKARAERAEWSAVRDLRCELGEFHSCASEWQSTPGGRIRKSLLGAGLRRVDTGEIQLLCVYELADYRGRTMSLKYGSRPPVEIELELQRRYGISRAA